MPPWIILIIISLANIIIGWQLLRLFHAPDLDWLERGFVSFALGTAVNGTTALILAELNQFHILTLAVLWLLIWLILWFVNKNRKEREERKVRKGFYFSLRSLRFKIETGALLLWFVAALWLFFRPHEFIIGGADAGVYTNLSASIVRQGGIVFDDPVLAGLDADLAPSLLRPVPTQDGADYYLVPAFFVTDVANGRITPQFYPLHPVWQAITYSLGGPLPAQASRASLLLTGLWALAGALAIYLTVRQAAGWQAALLALLGLSINAVQVWFARYPTTEMLSQFWLWAGLWAVGAWLSGRKPAQLWALLGGVALGQFFLTRIDALFMLPVLAVLGVWVWLRRQNGRAWFLLPLTWFIFHATAHGWWLSRPYFLELSTYGLAIMRQQRMLLMAAAVLALLALAGFAYIWQRYAQHGMAYLRKGQRPLLGLLAITLLLLAAYGWFIRPTLPAPTGWVDSYSTNTLPNTNLENFVRLGWYLSPLGVALGALGIAWMVWRVESKTAVLLAITLFYSLFYLWNIRANPHQIYASRRYIMAAIPLFVMGTAVLITNIATFQNNQRYSWRNALALLLTLVWLGSTVWAARGFISQVDYKGIIAQLDDINNQLQPNSVLLFADPAPIGMGDFWGTPLKFMYDHSVFTLRDPDQANAPLLVQTINNWQNNGYAVYWIGETAWLDQQKLAYSPILDAALTATNLEGTNEHKPQALITAKWRLPIVEISD
ncbi:MAG: hypothetical protein H6662_04140 [Ardenticatenaceae bacterium]|nr:hypothetical protein [Ardenticatenaceae bacterium]MCB8989713.1 hypothetical protein [Ardenticatenaceae bacterium]MCB9002828.1 hypothetical protein [Ardenticatenaceae bacterium]